jgi:acyl transferase domain-containing protein
MLQKQNASPKHAYDNSTPEISSPPAPSPLKRSPNSSCPYLTYVVYTATDPRQQSPFGCERNTKPKWTKSQTQPCSALSTSQGPPTAHQVRGERLCPFSLPLFLRHTHSRSLHMLKNPPSQNNGSYKASDARLLLMLIACDTHNPSQTLSCALLQCRPVPRLIIASRSPEELNDAEDIFTPC